MLYVHNNDGTVLHDLQLLSFTSGNQFASLPHNMRGD